MNFVEQSKSTMLMISIIYLILGIIMVVTPVFVSNIMCYIIGLLLLIVGGVGIFTYIRMGQNNISSKLTLLISILFTALGIYIFSNPEGFVSIIPLVIGGFLVIEGFDKIFNTLNLKRSGYEQWFQMLIISLIIFSLGLILILNPFASVTVFIRIIGVFLIVDAISNIYISDKVMKYKKSVKI